MEIKDIGVFKTRIYLGDMIDGNTEESLTTKINADMALIGSTLVFNRIKSKLPETIEDIAKMAGEGGEAGLEKLSGKIKSAFLQELTDKIIMTVRATTIAEVNNILSDIIPDKIEEAESLFEDAITVRKERESRLWVDVREPTEDQMIKMTGKEGEDPKEAIKRGCDFAYANIIGHNVTVDGADATTAQVIAMLKDSGAKAMAVVSEWQGSLPLKRKSD